MNTAEQTKAWREVLLHQCRCGWSILKQRKMCIKCQINGASIRQRIL